MSSNLTAQSEPINISKDQKIEIVKTLKAYPLVLKELSIKGEIIKQLESIVATQEEQISSLQSIISLERKDKDLLLEQNNILEKAYKKEIRRRKRGLLATVGAAALAIIIIK